MNRDSGPSDNLGSRAQGSLFDAGDELDSPRTSKLLAVAREAAVRDQQASQGSLINSRSTGGMNFGENSGDLVPMDQASD